MVKCPKCGKKVETLYKYYPATDIFVMTLEGDEKFSESIRTGGDPTYHCPHCYSDLDIDDDFEACAFIGLPDDMDDKTSTCPKCGEEIESLTAEVIYCGRYRLGNDAHHQIGVFDGGAFSEYHSFSCPECGEELFTHEEDANKFLRKKEV